MSESILPSELAHGRYDRGANIAESVVRFLLARATKGSIDLIAGGVTRTYGKGERCATVEILDRRAYVALVRDGSAGFGASFVAGWWRTDNLTDLVRFLVRNLDTPLGFLDRIARRSAPLRDALPAWRPRSRHHDRAFIRAHYDLSNDFYSLMLDETMLYSSAYFASPDDSLADAQRRKIDRLAHKLELHAGDHLVEVGTGWGGLATHVAATYGCRVTSVTISDAQFDYATALVRAKGLENLVTIVNKDYRDLRGTFTKLVSVEMVEAIGWRELDNYFATCASLLAPDGLMAIQAITIDDRAYDRAKGTDDFIKSMIFPGGFLPSVESLARSAARSSDLTLIDLEDIGRHYATTLDAWRHNLAANAEAVQALGFGAEFDRLWDMYLSYCEAAFLERHISDVQVVFARSQWRETLRANPRRVSP